MKRRSLLRFGAAVPVLTAAATLPLRSEAADVRSALTESSLIYLSPVKSDGQLSSCQSEVWYVMLGADAYVCTATSSWRAQAPRRGLTKTRLWAGDLGYWKSADYTSLPSALVEAAIENDPEVNEAALAEFGRKYSAEWGTWEPRFRSGLKDGTRSMLRYRLA